MMGDPSIPPGAAERPAGRVGNLMGVNSLVMICQFVML
jgi:hypothetical protein